MPRRSSRSGGQGDFATGRQFSARLATTGGPAATFSIDRPAASRGPHRSAGLVSALLQVYFLKVHVAETAPFARAFILYIILNRFPAPPLDLDKNEHAIRRISTPPVTMGLLSRLRAAPFEVLM